MAIKPVLADFKGGKYSIPDAGGVYNVSGATAINNVQAAIDNFWKQYVYQLLGVTLGDLIIAYDIAFPSGGSNLDYDKIISAFSIDNTNNGCCSNSISQSLGLKEYLKACIFYEYNKNTLVTSQAGTTQPAAETSYIQSASSSMRFAENKFNDLLSTADAIQKYCLNNSSAFPDFNGQRIIVKAANIL